MRACKDLSRVERSFRCPKGIDLKVRPRHHPLADRLLAHIFVCLLAYYVEWPTRERWAPLVLDDKDGRAAEWQGGAGVAPARRFWQSARLERR